MMFSLSLLSTLSLAIAIPLQSIDYVVHESRHPSTRPTSWSISHKAPGDTYLPVKIGLKQSNMDRLYEELMAISHPDSPNYGEHWSAQRVKEFFKPSEETKEVVVSWLNDVGFEKERVKVSPGGGWVEVGMTVEEAEKLFNSEYHVYQHESGSKHIACNSYSVPKHVQPHIDLITPTIHFDTIPTSSPSSQTLVRRGGTKNLGALGATGQGPKIAPTGLVPSFLNDLLDLLGIHLGFDDLSNCDKMITPNCLRALYNTLSIPFTSGKTSYGIVEYTPQAYRPNDLDLFFHNFSKSQVGQRPILVSIDGGVVQTTDESFSANGESNLDLEYAMALVGKHQPVTLYQVGDIVQGASFNNFLDAIDGSYCTFEGGDDPNQDAIYPDTSGQPGAYNHPQDCGTVKPADVISTSYGYNEADLSYAYAHRQCSEYGKLGMMGVTMIFSSGDSGVAGNGGECLNGGGTFNPSFPSGCPYVLSVGATQIKPNASVYAREEACETVIFSGGGFSNYFDIPDYQKSAVASYFANHNPPYSSTQYNNSRTSRGFPDISANGANYVVSVDDKTGLVYGTSASAPVVGSFLTMINNARAAFGKGPIGFINPTIYSPVWKRTFNDIVSGGNQGCNTAGFTAVKGWDPVTGLGTPNVAALLALWTAF